jgi:hypothetical protein
MLEAVAKATTFDRALGIANSRQLGFDEDRSSFIKPAHCRRQSKGGRLNRGVVDLRVLRSLDAKLAYPALVQRGTTGLIED